MAIEIATRGEEDLVRAPMFGQSFGQRPNVEKLINNLE